MITIILSTYDRPKSLSVTISAVQAQSFRNWRLLVVGDNCGPATADCVKIIQDERISYVNLHLRCGEQSGPNSVGMALAETPYIAFLNHDDIWMPDHLEVAVACLESGIEFFCGRAAFCATTNAQNPKWSFSECSPLNRCLSEAFYKPFYLFEPVSSWALSAAAAQRVGFWRAATELYRTPIEDWVLRAWREGLSFSSSQEITVLKTRGFGVGSGNEYNKDASALATLAEMTTGELHTIRNHIRSEIDEAIARGTSRTFSFSPHELMEPAAFAKRQKTEPNAQIFLESGYDAFETECAKHGVQKGRILRSALLRRTGEKLVERPNLSDLIKNAKIAFNA